jgi:hypothetical protein
MKLNRKKTCKIVDMSGSDNEKHSIRKTEAKKSKVEREADYVVIARTLEAIKVQKADLEKREKELRGKLDPFVDKNVATDNWGNRFFRFTNNNGKELFWKREIRIKRTINDDKSKAFFKKKKLLSTVYKVREEHYWDEDAITKLVEDGIITLKDVESISDKVITYASKVTDVEDESNGQ